MRLQLYSKLMFRIRHFSSFKLHLFWKRVGDGNTFSKYGQTYWVFFFCCFPATSTSLTSLLLLMKLHFAEPSLFASNHFMETHLICILFCFHFLNSLIQICLRITWEHNQKVSKLFRFFQPFCSTWSCEMYVLSERGNLHKCKPYQSGYKRVLREERFFSGKKKNLHYSSKDYREDERCELWLSFDKSYWADGSYEAEHSKIWNREKSQECSKRAGPHSNLRTRLRKIRILLHFWRSEGGGSNMGAECSNPETPTTPEDLMPHHNSVNNQMHLSANRLSKIQNKT